MSSGEERKHIRGQEMRLLSSRTRWEPVYNPIMAQGRWLATVLLTGHVAMVQLCDPPEFGVQLRSGFEREWREKRQGNCFFSTRRVTIAERRAVSGAQ